MEYFCPMSLVVLGLISLAGTTVGTFPDRAMCTVCAVASFLMLLIQIS